MFDWFGEVPAFIITLAADYSATCSDIDFCALVEHELYHIAQAIDKYGQPAFTEEGMPKLKLRGHDVEEFVGVVRRYGASEASGHSCTAAASQAAAHVAAALADVFKRADQRAGDLAEVADQARIRGLTCEQAYDGLGR